MALFSGMNQENKGALILVVTTFIAACGWIFSKETIAGLPPFGFIGLRFCIASLCLLPFCRRYFRQVALRDIGGAALTGCLLGGALMCWIHAISVSDTLGEGAFIMSLSMLIVPVVAWAMFGQRPQRAFWLALPVAVTGLGFLSLSGGWQSSVSQLWFLASAVMLALHFNVNRQFAQRLPVMLLTCVQLFVTGLIGLTISSLFESVPVSVTPDIWVWFALSTLLATSLRYLMQTTGQKLANAANAALIMLLEPIWTVVLSVLWYGEQLSPAKLTGCSLILFSLLVYRSGGKLRFVLRRQE